MAMDPLELQTSMARPLFDQAEVNSALAEEAERERRRQEDERLRAARINHQDPELARRVLSAVAYTGLPENIVASDLPNIERQIIEDKFDPEEYRKRSPEWASFLAENPYHLAALEEDMENMSWVGRSIKQIGMGIDQTFAQLEMNRLIGARIDQGGEYTPEQKARVETLKEMQVGHTYGAEGFVGVLVKTAQLAGPTVSSYLAGVQTGVGTGMAFGTAVAVGGGGYGPQAAFTIPGAFATGMAVGFTPGAIAKAYEMEMRFGYEEYRDLGVDHNTALIAGRTAGVINAALEGVSASVFLKAFPGMASVKSEIAKKIAGDIFVKPTVRRATGTFIAKFGWVHGTEILTEITQEAVTAGIAEVVRPDRDTREFDGEAFVQRLADTAEAVLVGSALISALGPTTNYYVDLRRAQKAKQNAVLFEALGDGAKASKTREALPEKFREWVGRVTKSGNVENIWIGADRFDTYFQSIDQDPDSIAQRLNMDLDALKEARELGGEVAIPLDEYTNLLAGTEHHNKMVLDIKARPGEMSAREAELFEKNKPEILRNIEEAAAKIGESENQAAADKIVADVTGQLVSAFYDPETAGKNAQLFRGIANIAERLNIEPMELFERVFGGVKRVQDTALQKRDTVDMQVDTLIDLLRRGSGPTSQDIFGPSLIDFLKSKGGLQDQGGELSARDVKKEIRGLVKDSGLTFDEAAELAAEAGYIAPQYDETMLLDALDREIAGEPVYGTRERGDPEARETRQLLDELEEMVNMLDLDLSKMSNEEVRKAIGAVRRFEQTDDMTLEQLRSTLAKLNELEGVAGQELAEEQFNSLVAQASSLVPLIDAHQDFSGVEFADTVRIRETGETVKITVSAQTVFDRAVKRKKNALKLLDCISD